MLFVRTEHLKTEYYRKKTNLYIIFRIRYTSEITSSDANCISLMSYLHKDAERSSEAERRDCIYTDRSPWISFNSYCSFIFYITSMIVEEEPF